MFGSRIKGVRRELSMTQRDLAMKLGVSSSAVNMWESEKRMPDYLTIGRICEILNVSSDYLLGRSDKKDNNYNLDTLDTTSLIIEKYMFIDEYGKTMVSNVIENEYQRCIAQKKAKEEPL